MEQSQPHTARSRRADWLKRCIIPHEGHVIRKLRRSGVAACDLEDVIQDTYVRLLNAESVDAVRDCRSYFVRAAMSVVLTRARRANVVSEEAQDQDYFAQLQSPEPGPDVQVDGRRQLARMEEALAALSDRSREVLTLRRIELLSGRQTAERMQISESAVEKHLTRATRFIASMRGAGAVPHVAANDETGSGGAFAVRGPLLSDAVVASAH